MSGSCRLRRAAPAAATSTRFRSWRTTLGTSSWALEVPTLGREPLGSCPPESRRRFAPVYFGSSIVDGRGSIVDGRVEVVCGRAACRKNGASGSAVTDLGICMEGLVWIRYGPHVYRVGLDGQLWLFISGKGRTRVARWSMLRAMVYWRAYASVTRHLRRRRVSGSWP